MLIITTLYSKMFRVAKLNIVVTFATRSWNVAVMGMHEIQTLVFLALTRFVHGVFKYYILKSKLHLSVIIIGFK